MSARNEELIVLSERKTYNRNDLIVKRESLSNSLLKMDLNAETDTWVNAKEPHTARERSIG